jgi:hypothetical protein
MQGNWAGPEEEAGSIVAAGEGTTAAVGKLAEACLVDIPAAPAAAAGMGAGRNLQEELGKDLEEGSPGEEGCKIAGKLVGDSTAAEAACYHTLAPAAAADGADGT